ncbi:MAG: UDP-glucose 4-epimerase GalE [Erysipelotrichaceae bacterium]|nr:UDP-glucose 4-epimerase GalE [Erysipelotrichaceae bacterium]
MKILVTGGMGYIGSHTVVELIAKGHECVILDNLYNSSINVLNRIEEISGVRPEFVNADITDENALRNVFENHQFDAVIHFAGLKAVGESVTIPLKYYDNNVGGSIKLYQLMEEYNVNNLVFSSSATVYGSSFEMPLKEAYGRGTTTNPYGTSKLMNEMIIEDYCHARKELSAVVLRYFNPVGAHKSGLIGERPNGIPNNLMPYISDVAIGKRERLNVFGDDYDTKDGTGVRDYIHVVDLAKAHVLAIEYAAKNKGMETINIGTGNGYSVLEIVEAYKKASGKDVPYVIAPRRAGDVATCYADPNKAKELLGFEAQYGIEDMCLDSYNFIIKNPNGIE